MQGQRNIEPTSQRQTDAEGGGVCLERIQEIRRRGRLADRSSELRAEWVTSPGEARRSNLALCRRPQSSWPRADDVDFVRVCKRPGEHPGRVERIALEIRAEQ